jgi:hypothetical protein
MPATSTNSQYNCNIVNKQATTDVCILSKPSANAYLNLWVYVFGSTKFSTGMRISYRGFKRNGGCVLGHNIITVPNLLYGIKRCSGTFGSILDLKEGLVQ